MQIELFAFYLWPQNAQHTYMNVYSAVPRVKQRGMQFKCNCLTPCPLRHHIARQFPIFRGMGTINVCCATAAAAFAAAAANNAAYAQYALEGVVVACVRGW